MTPEELIENFAFLDDWEDKYRYLIELGEKLPPMSDDEKTPENKVNGCMSQVWISYTIQEGKYAFKMDSDAHIVRGLEAVLYTLVNGKTAEEIKAIDSESVFNKLGLSEHLSPTRRNGFAGMVARIKEAVR